MKGLNSLVSFPSFQESGQNKRKSMMDRIRQSLQCVPLISKNRRLIQSRLFSSGTLSQEFESEEFSDDLSDRVLSDVSHGELFEEKYEMGEKLGEGSSGVVHRCRKRKTNELFAVKSFTFQDQHIPGLKSNFITLKRLKHPNIISYQALYMDMKKHSGWLVMELVEAPPLGKAKIEGEQQLRRVMQQILQTLNYLHRHDVVHRDVKLENILYDNVAKEIKFIDFGISRRFRRRGALFDMWTITGTLYYRAPEMFSGGYRQGVDVWAAGILLYKLVCGRTPFQSEYHNQTIKNIQCSQIQFPIEFESYSYQLGALIGRMLNKKSSERVSAYMCLKDVWFYPIPSHFKQHVGSMRLIEDEDCDNLDNFNTSVPSQYGENIGSLRFIVEDNCKVTKPISTSSFRSYMWRIDGNETHCIDSEEEKQENEETGKKSKMKVTKTMTCI